MPTTVNITTPDANLNPNLKSIVVYFYTGPLDYPQTGPLPAETSNFNQAHFCIFEGFSGANGTGASLGRGSEDTGSQTLRQAYPSATTIQQLLDQAFPAPGTG